MKAWNASPERG